jgi:hypothetical protein
MTISQQSSYLYNTHYLHSAVLLIYITVHKTSTYGIELTYGAHCFFCSAFFSYYLLFIIYYVSLFFHFINICYLYLLLVYLQMILLTLPSKISNANDALTGVVVFQLTPTHTHQFMHSSLLIKLTNYRHLNQYFSYFLLAMLYSICY